MFNPEKKLKQGGAVEDIVHIVEGGDDGYIDPYERDIGVKKNVLYEEAQDISVLNPDTGEMVKACSNWEGDLTHIKELSPNEHKIDGVSDDPDEILKYVEQWKRENKQTK
jgi:hypothetical protein